MFIFPILCIVLMSAFIFTEAQQRYVPAVCLKGMASVCFVLFGLMTGRICSDAHFAKLVLIGLLLGLVADILLNLRYVFEKKAQLIFLVGILVFLAGHILYLAALIPYCSHTWFCILIGCVLTALALIILFRFITAKPAFKIFGVFYIGAIMIMTCIAAGVLFERKTAGSAVFALGALFFLASDIILILNTFGSKSKQSLRTANLSLYYVGQLLIGLSLMFI